MPSEPTAASGPDLVRSLQRWEDFGGVWRILQADSHQVTVGLFRCDAGEEVSRFTSGDRDVLRFVRAAPKPR